MIYHFATRLAEMALRLRAGLGGRPALRERLCVDDPPPKATYWIHGASVGELTSARMIIEELSQGAPVLVTSNTETAREMVAGWGLPARLAPMDVPGALDRFLNAVQPQAQITVEGEFWPLRSAELARRRIPQAMIGARMSERSAARWSRLPRVIGSILSRLTALSAQDAASEARLVQLGLRQSAILPPLDLKLLGPSRIDPPPDSDARDMTVLAASTHEGEEALVLDAYLAARQQHPQMRLILAVRHPQRGDEVAALLAARGLDAARRSTGGEAAQILLVDTLGEMDRWYAAAGICLVGGSLADRGGHTPWEPAAYRCALLYGPHFRNYDDSFRTLTDAHAARQVSAENLGQTLADLVAQPAQTRAMGRAARAVLEQRAGDPAALVAALRGLANPHA